MSIGGRVVLCGAVLLGTSPVRGGRTNWNRHPRYLGLAGGSVNGSTEAPWLGPCHFRLFYSFTIWVCWNHGETSGSPSPLLPSHWSRSALWLKALLIHPYTFSSFISGFNFPGPGV